MMIESKINKLNNIIKEDKKFYFMRDIQLDYTFAKVGDEVYVDKAFSDSEFPSGIGVHIKFKNSGSEFDVDSDLVISRKQWVDLFNAITRKASSQMVLNY